MSDALKTPLPRPPLSGPGSDKETWRAYVSQETGRAIEGDLDEIDSRDKLIALVDQHVPREVLREAPEGVELLEAEEDEQGRLRPPAVDGQWVIPVEGGYVAEDELIRAERERDRRETQRRHELAVAQLKHA